MPCGGAVYGEDNLVFVANDWHVALLPVLLQAHYRDHGQYQYARSVLVLHNAAHQGRGPPSDADLFAVPAGERRAAFDLDDPVGGKHSNILKAGIEAAHRVVAVSRGYAWEVQTPEGGWGLHEALRHAAGSGKLAGIVNGIDSEEWSPSSDPFLVEEGGGEKFGYRRYSLADFREGKAACKRALQRELGLPERPDAPLLVFIGRLDHQKGVDLIVESAGWLASQGAQLVMLGSGRPDLEDALRGLEGAHRDSVRWCVVGTFFRFVLSWDFDFLPFFEGGKKRKRKKNSNFFFPLHPLALPPPKKNSKKTHRSKTTTAGSASRSRWPTARPPRETCC